MPVTSVQRLSSIQGKYQTYIFGIYGVIHSGTRVMPGALDCLHKLSALGKTIVLLSNSAQRSSSMIERLARMGIHPPLYQHLITAGEEAYQHLLRRRDPWHSSLGTTCYCIGSTADTKLLDGLDLHRAHEPEDADFILVLGTDEWHKEIKDYKHLLDRAVAKGIPMICANPDLFWYREGKREILPGAIAQYYESRGGEVYYHGKPYPAIYHRVFKYLTQIPKDQILAVGDSIAGDIAGAHTTGIDSVLVLSQVTLEELSLPSDSKQTLSLGEISEILSLKAIVPTYVSRELTW